MGGGAQAHSDAVQLLTEEVILFHQKINTGTLSCHKLDHVHALDVAFLSGKQITTASKLQAIMLHPSLKMTQLASKTIYFLSSRTEHDVN
jgi:hypothetical protein